MYRLRFARRANGRYPAHEFLRELALRDRDSLDKFNRIFQKFQEAGPESVEGLYKRLQGPGNGLVEMIVWNYRIFAFRTGDDLVLTNGFKKDQRETPPEELERGQEIKREELQRLASEKDKKQ